MTDETAPASNPMPGTSGITKFIKTEKIEKAEHKEKPEKIEHKEKPEKWEHKEKPEKWEHKEKPEKWEHKEKFEKIEQVEKLVPERVPIPDPGPIEQRLAALENALASLQHFITAEKRPDLSRGALKSEPDAKK